MLKYKSKPFSHIKWTFIGSPHTVAIVHFTMWLGIDGDCFCYNMKGFLCGLLGPAVDRCPLSIRFASQSKSSSKQLLNDIYASSVPGTCTQGFYSWIWGASGAGRFYLSRLRTQKYNEDFHYDYTRGSTAHNWVSQLQLYTFSLWGIKGFVYSSEASPNVLERLLLVQICCSPLTLMQGPLVQFKMKYNWLCAFLKKYRRDTQGWDTFENAFLSVRCLDSHNLG